MPLVIIPLRDGRSAPIHPFEALRDVLFDPVPHEPARAAVQGFDLLAEDPQHHVEVADVTCFARLGRAHGLPRLPLRLAGSDLGAERLRSGDLLPALASRLPSAFAPPCPAGGTAAARSRRHA